MRLNAQILGECVAVTIDPELQVAAIGQQAVQKLRKLKPKLLPPSSPSQINGNANVNVVSEIRKTNGGALLDTDDKIMDVLREGEFVLVVLYSESIDDSKPHPIVSQRQNRASKVVHTPEDSLFHVYEHPNEFVPPTDILELDGNSLTSEDLVKCGRGLFKVKISQAAKERIIKARNMLENIINENKVVYGVTTGFGNFSDVCIPREKLDDLQVNLIRSHACGIGPPLPPSRARMLLALRINTVAKGYSGLSLEVAERMVDTFNAFCVAWVPEKGTVGCSGDLAPLSHLALGLLGEGRMWSPKTGWDNAAVVLAANGIKPAVLGAKEGLALINGTQMVSAMGAEAVERANGIARQADVIAALTLDVLKGTTSAFDADVHKLRPHPGQIKTAERLRALLHNQENPSQIAESHRFCGRVQDAYTLRCVPQVHGVVHDTIKFAHDILQVELNSATDNPLIFADREETLSAGNFHGEYPAKVLDYLAIGVHELACMSERRLERLLNTHLSGLPSFLTKNGGLNSGLMMLQCSAAALVSENKVLCHPSSVDSIPTSCNQEDHVSMGGFAARKALKVVEHVEYVLAIELLAACQGLEFLKPLTSTGPLQEVYKTVRSVSAAIERDRFMAPEIEAVVQLLQSGKVWDAVAPHLEECEKKEADNPNYLDTPVASPTSSYTSNSIGEGGVKRKNPPRKRKRTS